MIHIVFITGLLSLFGWLYLARFHGHFWKIRLAGTAPEPQEWPDVTIVVPARNEAEALPVALPSLLNQDYPGNLKIILVDDHSTDGTGTLATSLAEKSGKTDRLQVMTAPELAEGWSGKVAAMNFGAQQSRSEYILFTDADIEHPVYSLRNLVARAVAKKLDLTSLMVKLHCRTLAEKLLIPAFVFYFSMLFPFGQVNDPQNRVAAAAGGVMLVRRKALENAGGLAGIKDALIDDCALAKAIKSRGGDNGQRGNIELTLSPDVKSLRVYPEIKDVWQMICRTAFTQLKYSAFILAGTVLFMIVFYVAPFFLALSPAYIPMGCGIISILIMFLIYMPMVRFYNLPAFWVLALPLAAFIYMGATIDSARLYWQGRGGAWKGRHQA